jgi:hypothetical protein
MPWMCVIDDTDTDTVRYDTIGYRYPTEPVCGYGGTVPVRTVPSRHRTVPYRTVPTVPSYRTGALCSRFWSYFSELNENWVGKKIKYHAEALSVVNGCRSWSCKGELAFSSSLSPYALLVFSHVLFVWLLFIRVRFHMLLAYPALRNDMISTRLLSLCLFPPPRISHHNFLGAAQLEEAKSFRGTLSYLMVNLSRGQ